MKEPKKMKEVDWYNVMSYIREVSGTVYEDQICYLLRNKYNFDLPVKIDIVAYLHKNAPSNVALNQKNFLKKDSVTGGIYTVPSQRKYLDKALREYGLKHNMRELKYNAYLYDDKYNNKNINKLVLDFSQDNPDNILKTVKHCCHKKIFRIEHGILSIKFEENCIVKNFNINSIIKTLKKELDKEIQSIGFITAQGVVFEDKTSFAFEGDPRDFPALLGGMFFDRSVFLEDFEMRNFTFDFKHSKEYIPFGKINKVDFRNTRFFKNASFRDVRFGGDTYDSEISFEDSRIQEKIEFINVDFEKTRLNFFQTIFGNYIDFIQDKSVNDCNNEISLVNTTFSEGSNIDFSDAEIYSGKVWFHNIPSLPTAKLCFSPIVSGDNSRECPNITLEIENCEIKQTLYIGNVSELSLKNTRNYGRIVSAHNWGLFNDKYKKKTRGLLGTRIGGTKINNNLLLAVYNYGISKENNNIGLKRNKANDFMVLKENFASVGAYDDEDVAFILYMEFKPYAIWYNRNPQKKDNGKEKKEITHLILYRALYDIGKYGISPGRVIVALLFLIIFFAIIYLFFAMNYGTDAFSIGRTNNNSFNYANELLANMSQGFTISKLLASFLYSLEGVIPFVSQFEPIHVGVCILTALENAIGSFLVGYFSVAVIRKTLR